jgi:hypothetical protein
LCDATPLTPPALPLSHRSANRTVKVQTFNPLYNLTQVEEESWYLAIQGFYAALNKGYFRELGEGEAAAAAARELHHHDRDTWNVSTNASDFVLSSEYEFFSSELELTHGPLFPCKHICRQCDVCNQQCARCQAVNGTNSVSPSGRRMWACDQLCDCTNTCNSCTTCLAANPAPFRQLWASPSPSVSPSPSCTPSPIPITVTCVDPLCGVTDPRCHARTTPPWVDIETTNALLHQVDNVLFPPNVLYALRINGFSPYRHEHAPNPYGTPLAPGNCPYTPANVTEYCGLPPVLTALFNAFAELTDPAPYCFIP